MYHVSMLLHMTVCNLHVPCVHVPVLHRFLFPRGESNVTTANDTTTDGGYMPDQGFWTMQVLAAGQLLVELTYASLEYKRFCTLMSSPINLIGQVGV